MSVIRTSANMIMKQLLHHPPLSFISFSGRPLLPCSRNPIIRLTPNRGISCSPIRCAAPDADADRKVSARLSQMQQLLQEAEERASSAGNGLTPQITLDHVTVSFARSGGPGGQNVNKVNTKVDMRFNVKQAYWLSDRIRERIMQMVRKEKLGDRITALHQLVSPFGKKNGGVLLQEDDIVVSNVRIDLTRGRQNPLESLAASTFSRGCKF